MNSTFPQDWRQRAFLGVGEAGAVLGLSAASIYGMAHAGRITLKSLKGRTLVPVAEVLRLEGAAAPWAPSPRMRRAAEGRRAAAARRSL
jgi:hypothetical protein